MTKSVQIDSIEKGEIKNRNIALCDLYKQIREGKYERRINSLRWKLGSCINLENTTIEESEKLPVIRFGQVVAQDIGTAGATSYTGLVLLSFGTDDSNRDIIRSEANKLPQTLMSFTGASGSTLKIVVPFTLPDGNLPTENEKYFHQHAFVKASQYYESQLGTKSNRKMQSYTKGCRISYDAGIYLNEAAMPMIMEQQSRSVSTTLRKGLKTSVTNAGYATLLPGYTSLEMQMTKYQFCYNHTVEKGETDTDLFIMTLARTCQKNGLSEEFAIKRLLHTTPYNRYELLVRTCFNNVYKTTIAATDCSIPKYTLDTEKLKSFLATRYKFRRNSISGGIEYTEEGTYILCWSPLTKEVINRITINALSEGIEAWDKDIKRYVESTFVQDYDPIMEYLSALPEWDGDNHIEKFASRIQTDNRDWAKNFHQWFLGMVAQWMGRNTMHGNAMVPLIIGAQGDGKSTFCRMILPEQLQSYYTDRIDFTNKNDAEKSLTRFALINVDEYDSITKRQNAFLKHILQKADVKMRNLYESLIQQKQRYAAFIGTTNDPSPLTDITGSRRYLCIQSKGKIDTVTVVDYDQLYAQAKAEILRGDKTYFDNEQERIIQLSNADFQQFDDLEEAFFSLYRRPMKTENGRKISVTDLLNTMHSKFPYVRADAGNLRKLGKMLRQRKFEHFRGHTANMYMVIENEQEP